MDHGHANNSQVFSPARAESAPGIYSAPTPEQPFFTAGAGNAAPNAIADSPDDLNTGNWHTALEAAPQSPDQLGTVINLDPPTTAPENRPLDFNPSNIRPVRDQIDAGTLGEIQNVERAFAASGDAASFYDNITKMREQYTKEFFPGGRAA